MPMAANKYCLLILILLLLLYHSLPTSDSRSLAISSRGPTGMEEEEQQQQKQLIMAERSTIIGHLRDHRKPGVGVHGTARKLVGVRGRGKSGRKRGKKRTSRRRNSGAASKASPWHVTSFVFCFVFLGRFML